MVSISPVIMKIKSIENYNYDIGNNSLENANVTSSNMFV